MDRFPCRRFWFELCLDYVYAKLCSRLTEICVWEMANLPLRERLHQPGPTEAAWFQREIERQLQSAKSLESKKYSPYWSYQPQSNSHRQPPNRNTCRYHRLKGMSATACRWNEWHTQRAVSLPILLGQEIQQPCICLEARLNCQRSIQRTSEEYWFLQKRQCKRHYWPRGKARRRFSCQRISRSFLWTLLASVHLGRWFEAPTVRGSDWPNREANRELARLPFGGLLLKNRFTTLKSVTNLGC